MLLVSDGSLSKSKVLSSAMVTSLIAAGCLAAWCEGSDRRGGGLVGVPAAHSDLRVLGWRGARPASGNDFRARAVGGARRLLLRVEVVPHSNVDVGPGSRHRAAAGDGCGC